MGIQYQYLTSRGALHDGASGWNVIPDEVRRPGDLTIRSNSREPVGDLPKREIPQSVLGLVPESVARENVVIPISTDGEAIVFAAAEPDNLAIADKLRFILARNVVLRPAPPREIGIAINRNYGSSHAQSVDSMLQEFTETAIDFSDAEVAEARAAMRHQSLREARQKRRSHSRHGEEMMDLRSSRPSAGAFGSRARFAEHSRRGQGMFHYTVDEGQRVLVTRLNGSMEIVNGPARVWRGWKSFQLMIQHLAHPGEFLIIRFRDGSQQHLPGPAEVWFDPRIHEEINRQDCLQIAAREAVVVYSETEDGTITRRVVHGPALFTPQPGEWLHTFSWHASAGGSQGVQKVPNGLVFQKLWLMPDQMYHDVPDVRTADDAVLTIRLMVFYELIDIDRMLDTTHDPIGDFVNAATADVVEFVGRNDFEEFKQNTNRLNELDTYPQLVSRATQSGYRINNVVYRGYGAPESLQQMHDQAIETRTRLQLERVTEEQAQELEDFKLTSQLARAGKRREEQADEVRHNLELDQKRHEEQLRQWEAKSQTRREEKQRESLLNEEITRREHEAQLAFFQSLSTLGVDMTSYLTQSRADQVIELRGRGRPHFHLADGKVTQTNGHQPSPARVVEDEDD